MIFFFGIRTKAKAIAQQERACSKCVRPTMHAIVETQEVVHPVFYPCDPVGRQLLCPLRSLRFEYKMHRGTQRTGRDQGDGRKGLIWAKTEIPPLRASQFFDRYAIIGIDAHFARNLHCFFRNLPG